jgi:hypothetical protein
VAGDDEAQECAHGEQPEAGVDRTSGGRGKSERIRGGSSQNPGDETHGQRAEGERHQWVGISEQDHDRHGTVPALGTQERSEQPLGHGHHE